MPECQDCASRLATWLVTLDQTTAGDDFPRLLCHTDAIQRMDDGDAISLTRIGEGR